jgi:predicted metal-dependent hydrolase
MTHTPTIVPREKLDFGLDGDIPRHWFGGDVFKSRYFDAMSTIFPEGERYFISCVRDFRDRITDPKLLAEVKDFMRQEGQHGIVHSQYNDRLRRQGIDVDKLEAFQRHMMFEIVRKRFPAEMTLADTAAAEHLTATMATALCQDPKVLEQADPRMRAMYAWHAMEEMEHKAVAFDVLQKVAKVGYFRRTFALVLVTFGFNLNVLLTTRYMLKVDGYSRWQRARMFAKGLWWLFGVGGLYTRMIPAYLRYFKPGFHPWETGVIKSYQVWLDTFNRTGDPLQAGEALQRLSLHRARPAA